MRTLATLGAAAIVVGAVPAQTVWSMGSPWTDLAAVVAQAAPGDIVLLNGLTFPAMTIPKGLTFLGPGTFEAAPASFGGNSVTTVQVPASQQAHFVDVAFQPVFYLGVPVFLNRVDVTGRATFDACTFASGAPYTLAVAGTVVLHNCTVDSVQSGLAPGVAGGVRVNGGVCSLVGSTVHGGDATYSGSLGTHIPATPAVYVGGGTLLISHTTLLGGAGTSTIFGSAGPRSALEVVAGSANIADCSLTAGAGTPSVPALVANATTAVARTTLAGGSTGPVQAVPQMVGLDLDHGWRLGAVSTITAIAGVNGVLGILAGFDGVAVMVPGIGEPVIGVLPAAASLALAVPAAGAPVVRALAVPNAPQLLGAALFVQAFQLDGALLRGSAAVGGAVR